MKRKRYTPLDWFRVGRAVCRLANAAHGASRDLSGTSDGHFTIMGFTTNVKAMMDTPYVDFDASRALWNWPAFGDIADACDDAIRRGEFDIKESRP